MDKINLEVFRFEAGVDYSPYYTKLPFSYKSHHTLMDMLIFLEDEVGCSYDKTSLGLRINSIAVFENLDIAQLVRHFGKEWQIDALSTYYASKDLVINKNILWKKYETFFAWASFIIPEEKKELDKYIMFNLITPMENEHYLGDGFFLYLKWLLSRYQAKTKDILQWILEPNGGILNFTSIADMVFPHAKAIDEQIWELMREVVFSYNYKGREKLTTLKPHLKDKR